MDNLPVELLQNIIERVDIRSLKSLRLVSRIWASLGEDYLIHSTFNTLPHRPDIDHLNSISLHPKYAQKIQHIHMNHGEVNEYHARHNTYFLQYSVDPETRVESQTETWRTYNDLKERKEKYMQYCCNTATLEWIFRRLPNLESFSVALTTCPFQDEKDPQLLRDVWQIPSTRLLPRVATTERFTSILSAIVSSMGKHQITALSHDRLPFEFFAQKALVVSFLTNAFRTLTSLTLALDYSDMPNNLHSPVAFDNLARCLWSAPSLRNFDLAMQGRRKIDVAPLLAAFEESGYTFACLENLTLQGIAATESNLSSFLVRQGALRCLQLGGIGVRTRHQPPNGGIRLLEGTFKSLFIRVANALKLESFQVLGDLVGQESSERWILEHPESIENLKEYVMD